MQNAIMQFGTTGRKSEAQRTIKKASLFMTVQNNMGYNAKSFGRKVDCQKGLHE